MSDQYESHESANVNAFPKRVKFFAISIDVQGVLLPTKCLFSVDEKREKRVCYEEYIRSRLIKLVITSSSSSSFISHFIGPLQILNFGKIQITLNI